VQHNANEIIIFDPELVLPAPRGSYGAIRRGLRIAGYGTVVGFLMIRSGSLLLSAEALPNVWQDRPVTDSIQIEKL
jgi:hypothetical protein